MSGTWESFDWPAGEIPVGRAGREELERLRLVALEERLADARRVLRHAAALRVPGRYRADARALAQLAGELHTAILKDLAG